MTAIKIADLNNAKQDVDHIADIATSTAATATDRLGHVKQTMSGVVAGLNAQAAITETGTNRAAAQVARVAAESARDAALIQGGVYVDEPTGRAAVADGVAFKVQGSGDVAAYEYRRVNSAGSVLIATYPSKKLMDDYLPEMFETLDESISAAAGRMVDASNKVVAIFPDPKIKALEEIAMELNEFETLDATSGPLLLDRDNRVLASLATVQYVANQSAPGSRESLAERLASGLTPYGDPIGPYANSWSLRATRMLLQKIERGEVAQVVLVLIGDSYTHGTYYAPALAGALQAQYGSAGVGWIGFSWWGTASGTWAAGVQPVGVEGSVRPDLVGITEIVGTWTCSYNTAANNTPTLGKISSSTSGDYVRFTIPAGHSAMQLFYTGDGTGAVQISWDDGVSYGATIALSTVGAANVAIPGVPSSAAVARVKVVSGVVALAGVDLRSASSGVRVHKLGTSGSATNTWSTTGAAWRTQITALGGTAHMVMFGTNDQGAAFQPSAFVANLSTIFANIKAALPGSDLLLTMPPENQRTANSIAMPRYTEAAREYAVRNDLAFIDLQYFFGSAENFAEAYAFTNAYRPWYGSDKVHPAAATGGRVIADAALRLITKL